MPSPLIRRGVWAIGTAVIVIALIVAALPLIASTRIVRDRIAWEMSAWSGFRVAIEGSPRIEVWPNFRAILTDVTLSQWTDTDAPPVVEAERVEVDLSAMAALRGDVVFSTARLVRPTIRVQRMATGLFLPAVPTGGRIARSIDTARGVVNADPAKPDLDKLPADTFGTVEFRDGRMVASVGGKDVEVLSSLTGQATWAAMNSNATLSATGIWRGESVALDVASPKPLVLFAGGTAPLTLSFKAAPATFSFDGTASMSENAYFDGQAKFSAPSLRAGSGMGAGRHRSGRRYRLRQHFEQGHGDGRARQVRQHRDLPGQQSGDGGAGPLARRGTTVISGTLAFDTLDLRSFLSAFTPLAPTAGTGQPKSTQVSPTGST